jgi:hypothetical protein
VLDFVEVAACAACGRGVDKEFDHFVVREGAVYCGECAGSPADGVVAPDRRRQCDAAEHGQR